jgi:hypothetical protein
MGNKIHFLLLGGNAVNANALLRFYVLHCMILPLTAMFFVAIHFWRIRKDGGLYSHASEPATVRARNAASSDGTRRRRNNHGRLQRLHAGHRFQREEISAPHRFHHPPHFGSGQRLTPKIRCRPFPRSCFARPWPS